MKKLLLSIGATAAIVAPVASVVACGATKGATPNKAGGVTPGQAGPTNQGPTNQGPTNQGPTNQGPTIQGPDTTIPGSKDAEEAALMNFKVSEITENPNIGYLSDVDDTPRNFKVFDNGLFQVKVDKQLIGTGKFFRDVSKALLEAQDVVRAMNIGPAINHLPKGIQILYSSNAASLGGNIGVQIATNNNHGSANDVGLKNFSSLISHEYGHHETMWDMQNLLHVNIASNPQDKGESFKDHMIAGLRGAGYDAIADICAKYVAPPGGNPVMDFGPAATIDLPSAYGKIQTDRHQILAHSNYPFNPAEIATRVLNILSYRTDLSAQDLYETGKNGLFEDGTLFEPGAAFISDATIRHFAKDSVFGEGKDNSRVGALSDFYMNQVFGLHQSRLALFGNLTKGTIIDKLNLDAFGIASDLDTIEIVNGAGNVVKSQKVSKFNSKFGFKDQLVSSTYAHVFKESVEAVKDMPLGIDIAKDSYKIVGKDASGKEVDLSGIKFAGVEGIGQDKDGNPVSVQYDQTRLEHSGKYIAFTTSK